MQIFLLSLYTVLCFQKHGLQVILLCEFGRVLQNVKSKCQCSSLVEFVALIGYQITIVAIKYIDAQIMDIYIDL